MAQLYFFRFVLATSVDPDEMPHYVAFHLGLHCLQKYTLGVTSIQRVNLMDKQGMIFQAKIHTRLTFSFFLSYILLVENGRESSRSKNMHSL